MGIKLLFMKIINKLFNIMSLQTIMSLSETVMIFFVHCLIFYYNYAVINGVFYKVQFDRFS